MADKSNQKCIEKVEKYPLRLFRLNPPFYPGIESRTLGTSELNGNFDLFLKKILLITDQLKVDDLKMPGYFI